MIILTCRNGLHLALCLSGLAYTQPVAAIELSGELDARVVQEQGEPSWTKGAMGKTRFGGGTQAHLAQAILAAEQEVGDAVTVFLVLNANDDRTHVLDMQEAWAGWNPVPTSAWKLRAKAGIFFPPLNQEQDYERLTWLPTRTISSSAINSWVGEELRTKGLEFSLTHRGRTSGSPHDVGISAAVFKGNDPAGTLLAWRGWSVGDRISGVSESLPLADLPVYRVDGAIARQTRDIHVFREIDGRAGYYVAAHYACADTVEVSAMHYDNRGDPMIVKAGQYSWATKFNHVGIRLRSGQWEWMSQYLSGSTAMGARAVVLDYHAWYALASRRLGAGTLTVRYDRFASKEDDNFPSDPNGEIGSALAIAYVLELNESLHVVGELLSLRSTRPARVLIGGTPKQVSDGIAISLRWRF
jgi:hypothetical protein